MDAMVALLFALWLATGAVDESPFSKEIDAAARQGRGTAEGRAAWERLSQAGPEALVPILGAMRRADTTACNWLRTVLDRIVQRERAQGKSLPAAELLAF